MQATNRLLDEAIADAFPDASRAEIVATVVYVRDAILAERRRRMLH